MKRLATCTMLLLFILTSNPVQSQIYSPDSSFNGTGIKTFNFYNNIDRGFGCAVQPDDKLILVGLSKNGSYFELCFARFNVNGSLDSSFNNDGKAYISMGMQQSIGGQTPKVKIASDGKIIATNSGRSASGGNLDFMVCRLDTNGFPDNSFNSTGTLFVDITGSGTQPDAAYDFTTDTFGNIYMTGVALTGAAPFGNDFAVVKINSSGQLVTSFDNDGKKTYNPSGGSPEFGRGIAVQPDGKIVFGGESGANSMLLRVDSAGVLDNTFNGTGIATINFGGTSEMAGIHLLPDGRIITVGYVSSANYNLAIARYLPNGTPDATFGNNGLTTLDLNLANDYATSLIYTNDQKILIGGYSERASTGNDFMVARVDSNGVLDTSFNAIGYKIMNTVAGNIDEETGGIALMNDGRIFLTGTAIFSSAVNEDISILRLKPDATATFITPTHHVFDEISVYPNPFQDQFYLSNLHETELLIYDVNGYMVERLLANAGLTHFNLSYLPPGFYFLREHITGKVFKLVKTKP